MLFVYNITSSWTELLRQNQMWIQKVAIGRAPPWILGPNGCWSPPPVKKKKISLPPLEQYMMRVFTIYLVELKDLNYYVIESKNTLFPSLLIYVCLYLVLFDLRLV